MQNPNSQKHSNFLDAIHLIMEAIGVIAKEAVLIGMIQLQVHNSTTPTEQTCQATAVQTKAIT